MKLILGHINPDFDALASMALATLNHPGGRAVLFDSSSERLNEVAALYRDRLQFLEPEDVGPDEVTELIVVDTADKGRIAPFDTLVGKVPLTLYDHHPRSEDDMMAAHGIQRELGSTVTILTLLLKAKAVTIPAPIASLALLGLHDDTGNLTYPLTQPEDHEAAAHLLREGASLELLQHFADERYSEVQRELFEAILERAREHEVEGYRVVSVRLETTEYVPLAPLCSQLLSLYDAEVAFVLAHLDDKTLVVARAKGGVDVGALLADALAGGGHPGAAFARTDKAVDRVEAELLARLPEYLESHQVAADIMSASVKTTNAQDSVKTALKLLEHYGHNGLPVLAEGALVGVVSRRILDRAMRHDLGGAPVEAVMVKKVVTAERDTPLPKLEALMLAHNVGRIPIKRGDELVGIVTRSDLLRARHGVSPTALTPSQQRAEEVLAGLPNAATEALEVAVSSLQGGRLYLVGGTVRDALLGVSMQDLDVSLEGEAAEVFGTTLQKSLGGTLSCHLEFGTCTLRLDSGLVLDIAATRDEYYSHPGALPEVTAGSLQRDLSRRDFSVNALAVRLSPGPPELVDPYGGLADLEARCLRTLHPLSFVEDPTRILRGARLAGRLSLEFEEATRAQLTAALAADVVEGVSASRLRAELELTLAEPRVTPALKHLEALGALKAMFGMTLDAALLGRLDEARQRGEVPDESYLLALLLGVPEPQRAATLTHFHWPKRTEEALQRLQDIRAENDASDEQLVRASEAEKELIASLSSALAERIFDFASSSSRRKLSGQDVLDLGLSAGPEVGEVLRQVADARRHKKVNGFDEELELAKTLVQARTERHAKSQESR